MKLKDKKIEILAVQSVINENGYAVETLEPICPPVWAYFCYLSGREYHAANAEHYHLDVRKPPGGIVAYEQARARLVVGRHLLMGVKGVYGRTGSNEITGKYRANSHG